MWAGWRNRGTPSPSVSVSGPGEPGYARRGGTSTVTDQRARIRCSDGVEVERPDQDRAFPDEPQDRGDAVPGPPRSGRHACSPEWCPDPEALDEIKAELPDLSYAEDLDLMAEFGRAVLDARDGTVRDGLDAVGEDDLRRALDRQERREALLAGFDRCRANEAPMRLGTPTAGAAP